MTATKMQVARNTKGSHHHEAHWGRLRRELGQLFQEDNFQQDSENALRPCENSQRGAPAAAQKTITTTTTTTTTTMRRRQKQPKRECLTLKEANRKAQKHHRHHHKCHFKPQQPPQHGNKGASGPLSCTLMACLLLLFCFIELLTIKQAATFYIDDKQSPRTTKWNYYDQMRWNQMNRDCSGRAQSPIDIQHKDVIVTPNLRLHFYNYNKQTKFKLSNAHHTVKMSPTGPTYDQEGGHGGSGGGGSRGGAFNHSTPIHDIIMADNDAADFGGANHVQHQQATGGGDENEHLAKVIRAPTTNYTVGQKQPINRQMGPNSNSNPKQQPQNQHSNDIERELEHERRVMAGGKNSLAWGQAHEQSSDLPYEGAPTIKLDWLDDGNNEYKLRDIHFHWGERRDNGSEHAIDGRRAAMEMHLVHIKHGLEKSKIGFTSDSVAVIAILIESHRKSNADFNPIVNELARINSTDQAQEIDYKSIFDLLPSNLNSFYTYSGSLTTPPCYQVVNWIVMAERLNMNAKQIEMFRNLYAPPKHDDDDEEDEVGENHHHPNGVNKLGGRRAGGRDEDNSRDHNVLGEGPAAAAVDLEMIMPNIRLIQALNDRTILSSFTKHGNRLEAAWIASMSPAPAGPNSIQQYHIILIILSLLTIRVDAADGLEAS